MFRLLLFFVTIILFFSFPCEIFCSWGESLFSSRRYDFGRVAIGAKAEYRFAITNPFKQDIRVISLNTSCGCTSSMLSSLSIASGGTEYLTATLNTGGQYTLERKAIITVHFETIVNGKILRDSAQLIVSGYIRPDVVLSPGAIEFGVVRRGEIAVRKINLEYFGKEGWELTKVERNNPYIHVKAEATPFPNGAFWQNGEIHYQITATLKPDAPAGYVKDVIKFSTTESNNTNNTNNANKKINNLQNNETKRENEIIIPINGVVAEPVQVKPLPFLVSFAAVNNAGTSKNIVVRNNKQFRILNVTCEDERFKFTFSEYESPIQIIAAIIQKKNNKNLNKKQNNKIQIHTNIPEQNIITLETIILED
ncbi:MAG: DUF1573 domain-containing protein [Planctomycetaceae bacterium]|jgi:hypothetical protein|nr:DUF1573 domain-containing protein [Planctomycetaceae bacterium]